ncbi:hypothetical protein BLNAU_25140 [Blattamonas nauphoetae]|uniref:Uncharacterized protein n=1 Tax=Blattamonas nauphoetae TaxID=2049346 RepID=A0ABQ9WPH5_9EUKA|nr:hypothetical protein BLNAU_25140 [Blattamonas nauphoetae]
MPPTYTNQEQSETTSIKANLTATPASPRTTPEKSRNSLRMSSNSHHVTLKPHIVCCPQLAFLFVDSGMSDECGTDTNSVRVANTREEGSDSEEPGERAEKNEDSTEDTRE